MTSGIISGEPSAEPTAQAFLLAWAQGQYKTAAALTTGAPGTVTTELRSAYEQLGAAAYYLSMGPITQHGDGTATARFYASVDLGQDGAPWSYRGQFTMRKTSAGWRVVWAPSVINPRLRPGLRLAVVSRMPDRAPVLDAEGASLIRSSTAFIAEVRPGQLKNPGATAKAFAKVTGLDREQVLSVIQAAPQSEKLTLLTLDPATFRQLSRALDRVPGLNVHQVDAAPVRQHGQRRDRRGRHRERPRPEGAGHLLPPGDHGRRVRTARGLPAAAGRHRRTLRWSRRTRPAWWRC